MNRLIIFTICVCTFCACKAQKDLPPPIEKIELVTEKGIQYKFPDNIEMVLNEAIKKSEKNLHFIMLETVNDSTYTLMVYCLNNPNKTEKIWTDTIMRKTGRYYLYKSESIPIIFDTDYKFSTPGFVVTHTCYWVTFRFTGNFKENKGLILQQE